MFFNNKPNSGGRASLTGVGVSRASLGSNNVANTGNMSNTKSAGNSSYSNQEDVQSDMLPRFPKRKRKKRRSIK